MASKNDNLQAISEIGINKKWVILNESSKQKWQLTSYKWNRNKQKWVILNKSGKQKWQLTSYI